MAEARCGDPNRSDNEKKHRKVLKLIGRPQHSLRLWRGLKLYLTLEVKDFASEDWEKNNNYRQCLFQRGAFWQCAPTP